MNKILFSLGAAVLLWQGLAAVPVVTGGRAAAEIRIPSEPTVAERFVAVELQNYLTRITGATLPIQAADALPDAPALVIGSHPANAAIAAELDTKSTQYDRFALVGEGDTLHFVAPHASGLLYSGWEFLERLGVEWLMPGEMGTYVPEMSTVAVDDFREFHSPGLEFRSSTNYAGAGEPWMLEANAPRLFSEELEHGINAARLFAWRMRLNANDDTLEARDAYVMLGAGHSYAVYLPIERYGEQHPEWFGLRDGKRQQPGSEWQICFNSEEAAAEFARNALEEIKNTLNSGVAEEHIVLFVSPNDHEVFCQCDRCNAMIDTDGYYSSNVLHFANMVAEKVHEYYPAVKVTYYVYHSYGRVPTKVAVAPGVYAFITAWTAYNSLAVNNAKPLMDPAGNRIFSEVFDWFSKNTAGVMVYPYYAHFEIFTGWPMATQMDFDFKKMSEYPNFIGMNSESHLHWATQPLNLYLFPKLLWNPKADTAGLIREFCAKAYGPGAAAAERYFAIQQQQMDRLPYICGNGIEVKELLPAPVIADCDRAMAEFAAAVPDMDAAQQWRARLLLAGWHYSKLYAEAIHLLATAETPEAQQRCKDNFEAIQEFLKTEQGRYAFEERVVNMFNLNSYEAAVQVNLQALPAGKSSWRNTLLYGSSLKFYSERRNLNTGLWGFGIPAHATGELDWTIAAAEGKITALTVSFSLAHPGIKVYALLDGKPELIADHAGAGATGAIAIPAKYLNTGRLTLRLTGTNDGDGEVIWLYGASLDAEVAE